MRKKKLYLGHFGTWYVRVRVHNCTYTKCGFLRALGNFLGTPGTLEAGTPALSSKATPDQTIQHAESGHRLVSSRRSAFYSGIAHLGMVPAQRRKHQCEGTRRENDSLVTRPAKLLPPTSVSRTTTTWRRFQHHDPPTHHISERGRCRGDGQAQSLPCRRGCRGIESLRHSPRGYVRVFYFSLSTKRHSKGHATPDANSSTVDRAISMMSLEPTR